MRLRSTAPWEALVCGLSVTMLQLALAVLLLAPQGPLLYRYRTLVQHDSYWFANIVNRGYATIVPPIAHKMMEVSNVAFFPAYPLLTQGFRVCFGLGTIDALLAAAQCAAWGFWTYFFLLCQRWDVTPLSRLLGALSIAVHPAAFFLVAAYSESLFLMALLGFFYWTGDHSRCGQILGAVHGIAMSASRIVGLPCALAPLIGRLWESGKPRLRNFRSWLTEAAGPLGISLFAMLGGVSFFLFCQMRWGHWDLYMLTQQLGWAIEPDYLAVFRPSSYRWLIPSLANPTEMSQMAMTIGAILLLGLGALELIPAARSQTRRSERLPIYFSALVIYFVSVSGVACVAMESMLRYELCVHALIVLALLHYLHNVPLRPWLGRAGATMAIALLSVAGFALESWYIWNFTRGNWVA